MKLRIQHPVVKAALWMVGTLVSFLVMALGGRELSNGLGTAEILLYRSLIGAFILCVLLTRLGFAQLRTAKLGVHTLRNIAHFAGQYGWFYGLAWIPLAEVFALEFTLPVWAAILAALLLGERITLPRLSAIGFGLVGMLIILRPGLAVIHPAAFAVLAGAACYALSHVTTRMLALADPPIAILFYMTVLQMPMALVTALPGGVAWPEANAWPWLVTVGITALSAHYCMTKALTLTEATVVIPIDFLRLPLIAVVGFVFYAEPLSWPVLIGAGLMVLGNYINVRAERKVR